MYTKSTLFTFSKSNRMKRHFYLLASILIFACVSVSGQPPCPPGSGNTLNQGNNNPINRNLNVACNTTVPNLIALHAWTATAGMGYTFTSLIQSPAAGTPVNLPKSGVCPNGPRTVMIIALFTDGMGNVCQVVMNDVFTVTDAIAPVINLPATVNVFVDGNCSVDIAAIIAGFANSTVNDNCTNDATLFANMVVVGPGVPTPAAICGAPDPDVYSISFQTMDACGNLSNVDVVDISVTDTISPTITCPGNVTLDVDASCMTNIPQDQPVTYLDNCDPAVAPAPGNLSWRIIASSNPAVVPIGNIPIAGRNVNFSNTCSPVVVTVRICAQDCFDNGALHPNNNNVSPNCCTYTYTIRDIEAPSEISGCGLNTNVSVDAACAGIMPNLTATLNISNNCGGQLTIYQLPAPGSIINDGIDDIIGLGQGAASLPPACDLPPLPDPIINCSAPNNLKQVSVSFVLIDCSGNCTVLADCQSVTLQDNTAPDVINCAPVTPIFNLVIDPATCTYSSAVIPADFFNGLAVASDNCDPDPIEHNLATSFNCSQLGLQNVDIFAEDCNGNVSGTSTCPVLIQANPLDADWNSPGIVCLNDLPLDLCAYINNPVDCGYWSGTGVTPGPPDNRCNGGTPATFDPGAPGNYSVTYTVGDANCHVELTRVITVEPNLNLPFLVPNGLAFCTCPDELIDFEQFLLNGTPQGGTWTLTVITGNPTFIQPGGPGAGNDHIALYTGGCGRVGLTYVLTDCGGATLTDNFEFTIHECSGGSFDVRADFCQDEASFVINDNVREFKGCDEYSVTFDVVSGPSGDALIGGAPVVFTIGTPVNVTVNPVVAQGNYRIRMTISDPLGICPDYVYEQVTTIHRDGANPNSIVDPGTFCEQTAAFPVVLNVQDPNDESGLPLPPADVRWFGTGITDIGTTANFTPPDTDGDGLAGPGVFTVCVDLGDARCTDRYCRDITILNSVVGMCNINDITLCLTPNQVISYDVFLSTGAPIGGTWLATVTPTPDLTGIPAFNGYIYTGGCGTLEITYSVSGACGAPVTCTGTITIVEKPNVDLVGDYNLCVSDPAAVIRNNGRTNSCGIAGVFSVGAGTPVGALVTTSPGLTATFNPTIAGEGRHYVIYTIGNPAIGCQTIDTLEILVQAASDPIFDAGGPYCIDQTVVNLSLINPDPSVEEGSPDNAQEVFWSASCVGCLTVNADSITALFNPSLAGPGYHLVCVSTGDASCIRTYCDLVYVSPALVATLGADRVRGCFDLDYSPSCGTGVHDFDLSEFYTPNTTRGGVWTIESGDCAINNETFIATAGCHELRYTVNEAYPGAGGACAAQTSTVFLLITEEPKPDFEVSNDVCWDGVAGSLTVPTLYNGETFGDNAARTYAWVATGAGSLPSFSDPNVQQPTVTVQGAGTFTLCLTETLVYGACGANIPAELSCSTTHCEQFIVHQTTVEAIPTWTPPGPFCVDQPCVDLDVLVASTSTPNGVFTGKGVQLDPSHPNYRFCPTVAGVGTHSICYTVNNGAGCTAVECHNIVVYPSVSLACTDTRDTLGCATRALGPNNNIYGPHGGVILISRYTIGTHPLNSMLCPTATQGGAWTFLSGPAANTGAVAGGLLYFTNPGCYTVRYTVRSFPGAVGACAATQDFTIHVGEEPNPSFDFPNSVCWDQVTPVTYTIPGNFITSPAYSGTVVRTYRSTNPAVATVGAVSGIVTIVGNGTTTICMQETITTLACGILTPSVCIAEACEILRVVNNTTVVNPSWTATGPFCETLNQCIDLDALVTGTPNGIFTGTGVQLDPAHPNYCFNPSIAGVGTHAVTYTVNSPDGCTSVLTRNIEVRAQCVSTLNSALDNNSFGCYQSSQFRTSSFGPRNEFDLSRFYLPTTTRGGVWTIVNNPPNTPGPNTILNETLFGGPGCYTLRYTATCPPCGTTSTDINFSIVENPTPVFDMTEEACWDGVAGSIVLPTYYQGTTWGTNAIRDYSWSVAQVTGPGPVPTLSSGVGVFQGINNPSVTVNGAGTFDICVTERLQYVPCQGFAVGTCTNTYCERLTIHQTNVEVIPSWTPAGPFCVDQPCIDLDIRVTGNTGGVFRGAGVQLDPSHPNYRFCPAVAGPGTHSICYTVNNAAGCTAVECHNISVYPTVSLACADTRDTLQCATRALGPTNIFYGPHGGVLINSRYTLGTHPLNSMLCSTATQGGTWTYVSGPAANTGAVAGGLLYFTTPGCYTVRYTVSSFPGAVGGCTATQDFTVHVGEAPNPSFDFPDDVCWDQVTNVTFTIPGNFITSPAYTGTVVRTYRSTNPAVATVGAVSGIVTIVGNGTTSICMQETITTIACGIFTPTVCISEACQVLRVVNSNTIVTAGWNDPGPICIDQTCIDLDALVTGTPNGVFTGRGVRLDPTHPNYCFDPAVAGVGTHAVTYTVNSPDACTSVMTRNIVVFPANNATLKSDYGLGCLNPSQFNPYQIDLSQFYNPATTRGGTWTYISGPGNPNQPIIISNETATLPDGCHQLRYTVNPAFPGAIGACGMMSDDIFILLGQEPDPSFDLAEEVCWDGIDGSITLPTLYNGNTLPPNNGTLTYLWTVNTISGGPVPTFSSNTIQQPSITVHGAGVFQICLRENISYNSCGTLGGGNCNTTQCELITIHQTNTEVIPSWTPIGPFCVDNTNCIDLDARVTGNTGGVFKGIGVRLDPTHPNYCFTPSVAGVGTHVICYTVQNGAGCTAVECHNVVVYPTVSLACADAADTLQCATRALGPNTNNYGPHGGVLIVSRYSLGTHSLNALLCPTATRGGTWSYISGPASSGAVADGLLYFSTPGCYTVRYTVSSFPGGTGGCTATQDFTVHVGELPNPSFDLPDNVCWDQVNVVQFNIPSSFLTSPTYSGTVARSYRSTNTGVATVNAAGVVTVVGNGTTTICMEETITTVACGVTTTCKSEFCEVLRVQNNTTVVNPAWTAIGPFCIDQPCVLLAPLVTGTTGGIFTGQGVRPPGGALVHPNYEFCPAVAGVGIHAVTYTVNSPDGCTAILTRNISVYPAANASLVSDSIVCQVEPTGIIDLTALFTPLTTGGGVFTKTGGPASGRVVGGNQFNFTEAGCYCFLYTVSTFPGATGACLATGTACLLITEQPTPNFDIQNERCWNVTDPVALKRDTLRVNSPTYDPAGVLSRTLRVNSGPAVVISNGPTIFAVEYTGSGNVVLCFEEKLTYAACGTSIPAGRVCIDTLCRQISVQDGTALNATFTVTGAKTEYCPGDTITFTPVTPGGIFSGTNVGNSNPVGTNGGLRFTGCGVYVVTYSVETPAGCENVSSQTFFTDRTNPVFVGPLTANRFDTVVECDGASQTARMNAWASRFTFTDNCQFRTFFKVFDRRSGCSPSTGLYVFEVTGRDTCGNETNVYPSYRVQDTTRPSFTTLPTDLVIECGNETDAQIINWLNINGRAIATDICSGNRLRWSHNFSGDIADYCSATGTLVTFTVFDECNNSNNASARIIVRDQTPPIWNVRPQNLTLECDGTTDPLNAIQSWLGKNGDGVAIDSCQLTVRYTNNFVRLTGGCNRNTGSALVTFTASDACGNSVTAQATVAVRDIVAPQITSPAKDTTIFCSVANGSPANITTARTAWLNAMGRSVSFDQCDGKTRNAVILPPAPDFTSSTLMRTIQGCAAPLVTETWMFQYRDSCGNLSAGTIAEFRVRDTTAPVWSVNPANMIAECDRNGNPPNLNAWLAINGGGVLLVDDCNGTTRIEHDLVRHYDKCSNTDSMIYRFTAFDCSGNSSFREATFYIRDITAPVIDPASGYNKLTSCDQSNAGNDDDIVAWLDSFGGLRATDACSDVINWRHNFSDTRWVKGCGDTRTQAVTFTATDDCGNFSNRTLTVGTVDTTKPVFFNCPRPPIVVAAETFHCDAYVNFSPMAAFDNCSVPTITQIDKTGLRSGDRFPVGTTILVFEAKDPCDNRDTCSLKIIVNDYWDVPTITCPAALTVNTAIDSCGISVISPSLKPTNITDNCPNTGVTYQIKDSTGKVIKKGFTDASGSFFPVGKNTIDYCVYDQPIVLISEVTQMFGGATTVGRTNPVPAFISANVAPQELIDGDFIEITNYGPSVVDLTCLSIEITDAAGTVCTYVLPPKFPLMPMHFLAPGRVATFHVGAGTDSPANLFFNMNCTQVGPNVGRGYSLKLNDRNIDVVATNGFNPVGKGSPDPITINDWKGALSQQLCRGSYYRISHMDMNLSSDWDLATSCIPATIGSLNKDHKFIPSNGDTVALQSILANVRCCSSTVTVLDVQAPECAKYDTLTFINPTNLNVPFNQGTCFKSTITVPNNCLVGDFRLLNLTGNSSENLGDWKVTLVSPSGTRILIWDNICPAATSFNLNVSELAAKGGANGNITSAPCVPNFGNGGFYKAQETMNSVYHERSNGIWTLELEDNSCSASLITNVLSNWRLQILCISPAVLRDTIVNADFRQCHKKFLWYHPVFNDNCKGGTMDVSFTGITQTTPCGTTLTPSDIPANKKNVPAGSCDSVLLSIGTTKFTYILTDRSGNTGMCMFSVTVRDVNAPVVTANKDITISSDPGDCGKFFNFPVDAIDSCGVDSIWSVPANGSYFKGTTRVCVYARDKSCNIDSSCFNVTVNPYIPTSAELVCNDQLNLSLDQNCSAVLNADMILEGGNHYCYNDYIITVKDASNNVPHPNRFNYSDVGKCFIVTVTDPRSGNSCWGKVCIEDKQKPNIACPRDTIVTCISTIDPDDLGRPTLLTCEQSYTFEYHDDFTEYGECASPYVAEIQRNWIVVDETGNSDTCIQYIYIRRLDLADIKFPKNYDDITYPSLECQDKKYDKDVSQHITPYPECVDDYLLDSAIWKSSGGLIRVPRKLGWNFLTSGPNAGHPSPYPIYYDAHPQYSGNRLCWGPDQIVKWEGTGYPTIDGIDLSLRGRCAISMKYVDDVYEVCENSTDILREWSVRNMCLPVIAGVNPFKFIQNIKVLDKRGPEISYPDTLVITTDNSSTCKATWVVSPPWIKDNCSDSTYIIVRAWAGTAVQYPNGTWAVFNLPVGVHRMEIVAKDKCGNSTVKKISISVVDGLPPVPICRTKTVVSVNGNLSPSENGAKIYAESFDEGSYDNCSPHVFFKTIRMADLLGTNNGSTRDNTVSCGGSNGDDDAALVGNQVYFDDYTRFCCEDVGKTIMVVLRVFDVDPGAGPINPTLMNAGRPLFGHFSDCMIEVEVQNKGVPTVIAPPNMVVSCWYWFDITKASDPNDRQFGRVVTDLNTREKVKTSDIVCHKFCERNQLTGYPGFVQTNQVPMPAPNQACVYYNQLFDSAHWDRKYELVWGFDGYALSACGTTPTIVVNDLRECGQGQIQRIITAVGPNNSRVNAIQTIWVVDCDPFFIDPLNCNDPRYSDIQWPNGVCNQNPIVINGCGADISPENPQLGKPTVVNNADDNCSLISIEHFDETFTIEPDACFKVLRKWVVIDWCQYDPFIDPNIGRWEALQIIKVRDQDKPVVTCNVGPCEPASIDPTLKVCVGHISLTATATDNCTPLDWLFWEYKIDAYNDGKGVHGGYDFRVGTLTQKQYNAGDTVEYSHNPFADDNHNPFNASGTYPIGIHKIRWNVEDGCGNIGVCETLFEIKDCKAPTPYCITGVITVPMPSSGCVDIWAKDLNLGSYDNCTPKDSLKFYFDGDENKPSIRVCCDDFVKAGQNDELRVNVEMWVQDEEGNKDYCKTVVIVQDNLDSCLNTGSFARIVGNLMTEGNEEAKSVKVQLERNATMMREVSGSPYKFGDLVLNEAYTVKPIRNDDHLNGVSTADIVKIQKHILGQAQITSPYKLIAADVNASGTVTAADISEIRKLILGVIPEFGKVQSWTFVPDTYTFADPTKPFNAPRTAVIKPILVKDYNQNFMAIKMGDLTGNAKAGLVAPTIRTTGIVNLEIEEAEVVAGTYYKMAIRSSDFTNISGYQFTMNFDHESLIFEKVESGVLNMNETNVANVRNGILTTSWNSNAGVTHSKDEVLYTVVFKAVQSGKISKMITITSDVTHAEAYDQLDQLKDVKLVVRTDEGIVETGIFELYQNEPNPFRTESVIGYRLPEAAAVKLTIYDVAGKVVRVYELQGQKGLNQFKILKSELSTSSVLYYQLDAADHTATKRMFLVD